MTEADLEKLRQTLRAITALQCNCELLKTTCAACLAKNLLNEKEAPEDERAMFSVFLDGINNEPPMVVSIARKDGLLPIVTNTDDKGKRGAATQEMLLRLAGVLVDALSDVDEFKVACAKWGLDFAVQQG